MRWRLAVLVTGVGLSLVGVTACGPKQVSGQSPISGPAGTTQQGDPSAPATTTEPAAPFVAPTAYQDKSWSYRPDPNYGGSGAYTKVPQGWGETKRGAYWSDFLDPTGQVRLRVDVTAGLTGGDGPAQTPGAAAAAELSRLRAAAGFKLISQRDVPVSGDAASGAAEIVYQFSRDGQTVQCTYRFVGDDAVTYARVAVYYPASEQQKAEAVLGKVHESLRFAG